MSLRRFTANQCACSCHRSMDLWTYTDPPAKVSARFTRRYISRLHHTRAKRANRLALQFLLRLQKRCTGRSFANLIRCWVVSSACVTLCTCRPLVQLQHSLNGNPPTTRRIHHETCAVVVHACGAACQDRRLGSAGCYVRNLTDRAACDLAALPAAFAIGRLSCAVALSVRAKIRRPIPLGRPAYHSPDISIATRGAAKPSTGLPSLSTVAGFDVGSIMCCFCSRDGWLQRLVCRR